MLNNKIKENSSTVRAEENKTVTFSVAVIPEKISTNVKKTAKDEPKNPSIIGGGNPNWEAIKTQKMRVLAYLKAYGSITKQDAYDTFKMFELPVAICQLRKDGYVIDSESERDRNNKKLTRYKLRSEPGQNEDKTDETN